VKARGRLRGVAAACAALLLALTAACSQGGGGSSDAGRVAAPVTADAAGNAAIVLRGVSKPEMVAQLTGRESTLNRTDRYGVYGTDLGSMFDMNDKTYFVFGDTFGSRPEKQTGAGGDDWRSNVMAVSTDNNPADGILFDRMIEDRPGHAKELLPSAKIDRVEMTKIPTHGIAIQDTMYLYFMSVKHWGDPGEWEAGYSGLAKSTDGGENWSILDGVRWPGDSGFIQVSPYRMESGPDAGSIYFWCIPAGRFGQVRLMKVNERDVENLGKYRYFAGMGKDGSPIWSADMAEAVEVAKNDVGFGELSVVWNPYLERWLMTYLKEGTGVVIREGLAAWGPWGDEITMANKDDFPSLYGPYMNPKYTEDGGRTIYFTLSLWEPYNVFWLKTTLEKKQ